jgi:gentisate 1,2-dioxygenase
MAGTSAATELGSVDDLDKLNRLLAPISFRAGWNKAEASLWPSPKTKFRPSLWSWENAKAGLDSAGRLIDTEQADRRNLFMVNPTEGNNYATLRTLVSAYQMILPGERAKSHRHSPNALRLVLDVADDCFTVVDGVRIDMKPGDVLLTPNWCWHGHANDGDRPGYWIDFLDVPLVHLLEGMFFEHWPEGLQRPEKTARSGPFVFAWDVTEKRLSEAQSDEHGRTRVELGAPAMDTTALFMDHLAASSTSKPLRMTANQIVAVVKGAGRTTIEDEAFEWKKGDVIAVPAWHRCSHEAYVDSVLFNVSDAPLHEKLGFLRVQTD